MHYSITISIVIFGFIALIDSKSVTLKEETVNIDDPNCSRFRRDIDVLRSFSYPVQLNPMLKTNKTYAIINDRSQIEELYIQHEINLPYDVFCLVNLHTLKVNSTPFVTRFEHYNKSISTGLSPLISRLNRLRVLTLVNTTASHIPHHALAELKNLTTLEINNCSLREIPRTITSLTNLQVLRLPNNHISSLPHYDGVTEGINSLKNLTEIVLSNNRLVSLEPLSNMSKLSNIVATNCHLKVLPVNLTKLQYMNVSHNNLMDLSDISDLSSSVIYSLDFSNNEIDYIPIEISRYSYSLRYLYLNNNSLYYLPTNIFQLKNIQLIDLRNNTFPSTDITAIRSQFRASIPYGSTLV